MGDRLKLLGKKIDFLGLASKEIQTVLNIPISCGVFLGQAGEDCLDCCGSSLQCQGAACCTRTLMVGAGQQTCLLVYTVSSNSNIIANQIKNFIDNWKNGGRRQRSLLFRSRRTTTSSAKNNQICGTIGVSSLALSGVGRNFECHFVGKEFRE